MMREYIEKNMPEMVRCLKQLVSIPGVFDEVSFKGAPFGKNIQKSLEHVLDTGQDMGFQVKNYDGYAGEITVGKGKRIIGILCHTDVVSAGEGWETDPFDPVIKDGKIYGRGTSDDKGPLVSSLFAMKYLADNQLIPDDVSLRMIIGTDEEESWQCIRYYLNHTDTLPEVSIVPDANFPLLYCEKGLLDFDLSSDIAMNEKAQIQLVELKGGRSRNIVPDEAVCLLKCENPEVTAQTMVLPKQVTAKICDGFLKLTSKGISTHCMSPEKGCNAVSILLETLGQFGEEFSHNSYMEKFHQAIGMDYDGARLGCAMEDSAGALTFNVGTVCMQSDGQIFLQCNIRYPASVEYSVIRELLEKQLKKNNFLYHEVDHLAPVYHKKDAPLIRCLMDAYQEVTGDKDTEPMAIGGATYARALPNAVAFGPLFPYEEELAHEANEYLSIDSFRQMTEIYAKGMYKLMTEYR